MNTLEEHRSRLTHRVAQEIQETGSLSEFSHDINELSRNIVASLQEKGPCFGYKINLYDKDRGQREAICQEIPKGEAVLNFGCRLVAPLRDERLIDLILERDQSPYTGTKDDANRIETIYQRAEEIGAIQLHWV